MLTLGPSDPADSADTPVPVARDRTTDRELLLPTGDTSASELPNDVGVDVDRLMRSSRSRSAAKRLARDVPDETTRNNAGDNHG